MAVQNLALWHIVKLEGIYKKLKIDSKALEICSFDENFKFFERLGEKGIIYLVKNTG